MAADRVRAPSAGLRVAFDMDGTVADMHSALERHAAQLFEAAPVGPGGPVAGPDAIHHLKRDQQRLLWDHVERVEDFWTTLPEMEPGIIGRIFSTARARRWEVLFITTRPATAGDPTQRQTQRWLQAHGFDLPSVCVLERSRGRLASVLQLHAVVDDRPENCLDVAADSKAKSLLIWPGPPETMPEGLQRVGVRPMPSIREALAWLERYDDERKQSPVIRSVRRFLGRSGD